MKHIIKFEAGLLLGTLFGAVISAIVCSLAYEVLGYESIDADTIQRCIKESLNE